MRRTTPIGRKFCGGCRRTRAVEDFASNRAKPDLLQTQCRTCRADYYETTRERVSRTSRAWYARNRARRLRDEARRRARNKRHR